MNPKSIRVGMEKMSALLLRPAAFIALYRGWQAIAGTITLIFVTRTLSSDELGWYYAFLSLAASYTLLDFGLSTLLVPTAARFSANLNWSHGGVLGGTDRLAFLGLCKGALKWYTVTAVAYLLLIPAGLLFFPSTHTLGYDWRWPWIGTVIATALSQMLLPWMPLLEGSGQIRTAYIVRLTQAAVGATVTWLILAFRGGLYATIAAPLASFLVCLCWLLLRRRAWLIDTIKRTQRVYRWGSDLTPLQWRFGVSWVCGYALGQIHVPVLFRLYGAVAAGQMGVALSLMNTAILLAQVFITSKVPLLTELAHRRAWAEMDRVFSRGLRFACVGYLVLAGTVLTILAAAPPSAWQVKLLPVTQMAVLFIAGFELLVASTLSGKVRTYRREPFVINSLVSVVIMFALLWMLVPKFSTAGDVSAIALVASLVSLPWIAILYVRGSSRYRAELDSR